MWLVPSIIATLAGVSILTVTYLYLYYQEKRRFLAYWAVSWALYALRLVAMLYLVTVSDCAVVSALNQVCALASGFYLLWGTIVFTGRRLPKVVPPLVLLFAAHIVVSHVGEQRFLYQTIPTYFAYGAVYICSGIVLLVSEPRRGMGKRVCAVVLIAWGLHKIDYPFLRPIEWFAPVGYLIGALCALVAAIAIVVLYFEQTRDALVESRERLSEQERLEALGRLAGGVAHDFNNTLTTILGYADYLDENAADPIEVRESAGEIRVAAEHAALLARQLQQVLLNLTFNARDAMDPKAVSGLLTIRSGYQGADRLSSSGRERFPQGAVTVEVTDTGVGMSEEVRKRVFEPFFTTKPFGRGTGLGLSTVVGVIDQSGGAVEVSAAEGIGTRFTLRFPPAESSGDVETAEPPPSA